MSQPTTLDLLQQATLYISHTTLIHLTRYCSTMMSDNINICTTGTEEETNALIDYFHTNQSTTTLSSSARDYKGAAAHISTLFKGRPKMVKSIKTKFSHVSFQQYGQHPFKLLIFQQIKTRWTLIDKYRRSSGVSWESFKWNLAIFRKRGEGF